MTLTFPDFMPVSAGSPLTTVSDFSSRASCNTKSMFGDFCGFASSTKILP